MTWIGGGDPKPAKFEWHPDMMAVEMQRQWLFLLRRMGVLWPEMRPLAAELSERLKIACEASQSPIEIRLIAAMLTHNWGTEAKPCSLAVTTDFQEFIGGTAKAVLMPQCDFGRYRLDFCLRVQRGGTPIFCAVEADGAAYHDAEKDAERDKWCARKGIETYRFKGREINNDGPDCAALLDRTLRKREGIK